LNSEGLFQYRWNATPIHKINPFVKLILLITVSISVFISSLPLLSIPGSLVLSGYLFAKRSPVIPILRGKVIVLIIIITLVTQGIANRFPEGIEFALKLLILFLLGNLYAVTTTAGETGGAIYAFLSPLSRKAASYAALMFQLTILFIPEQLAIMHDAVDALKIRGGKPKRPVLWVKSMGVMIIAGISKRTAENAEALAAREWRPGRGKPCMKSLGLTDAAAICCGIISFSAVLVLPLFL
jgi:energy-coupling factor transporter transmembrane protein EcfT